MAKERLTELGEVAGATHAPVMWQQLQSAAQEMIAGREALRKALPIEFVHCPSLDLLCGLFVADGQTASFAALIEPLPVAPAVAGRWIDLFVQRGLVARSGESVMLTDEGIALMTDACQAIIRCRADHPPMRLN